MSSIPKKVIEVLKEMNLSKEEWDDAGWVLPQNKNLFILNHKTCEKIGAFKNVEFDAPTIIASDPEKKIAVMTVVGRMGNKSEWSIGECATYNNKNNYPYSMAEKRAKDRVILKLVGLHGDVYSEDEADDFVIKDKETTTGSVMLDQVKKERKDSGHQKINKQKETQTDDPFEGGKTVNYVEGTEIPNPFADDLNQTIEKFYHEALSQIPLIEKTETTDIITEIGKWDSENKKRLEILKKIDAKKHRDIKEALIKVYNDKKE